MVYTHSATIYYLLKTFTLLEIRRMINVDISTIKQIKRGRVNFTKLQYLTLIERVPELKGQVHGFEKD